MWKRTNETASSNVHTSLMGCALQPSVSAGLPTRIRPRDRYIRTLPEKGNEGNSFRRNGSTQSGPASLCNVFRHVKFITFLAFFDVSLARKDYVASSKSELRKNRPKLKPIGWRVPCSYQNHCFSLHGKSPNRITTSVCPHVESS